MLLQAGMSLMYRLDHLTLCCWSCLWQLLCMLTAAGSADCAYMSQLGASAWVAML